MRIKKMIGAILLLATLCMSFPTAALAQEESVVQFDESQLDQGIISICYNQDTDKPLKVKILKVDTQENQYYDLEAGKMESYPLPSGNGSYQISVLKQYEGSSYFGVDSTQVELTLEDPTSLYLGSIQNIEWNQEMTSIQLAQRLTANAVNDKEKVDIIYNYIVKNFKYDYAKAASLKPGYRTNIEECMLEKKGICYDYSALMAGMLRSVGVPTKLIKGYSTEMAGYHAWNQVYLEGSGWVNIDTTADSYYYANGSSYQMIKSASKLQILHEM
ncbi:transglutaminase domain-containing protein [Clostridia bacterium]|nr:transglutaminase domain-containing protein [Clostridia bacterium]